MKTLLVTSTHDGTGKTAIAIALGLLAADRGREVGYMKPKGTRLQSTVGKTLDRDPMLARDLLGTDAEMHEMEPIVYSPTFVRGAIRGRERPAELRERVRESFDALAVDRDLMIVEGGGRLTTGGVIDLDDADVAELLDAEAVVVADHERPGDLDDVLAAADALGDRLAGVLFNRIADAVHDDLVGDVVPFLEDRGIAVPGVLPREPELAGVTVATLAAELGAETLTDPDVGTDALVERFLVGAMSGDAALRHFRRARDAAVITGGDRSEVQIAALQASGVNCLIVTGGHRPTGAVLGTAAEEGVPVLRVTTDTLTAIERAEEVVRGGRTRDRHAVELVRDLLADRVDVAALLGGADAENAGTGTGAGVDGGGGEGEDGDGGAADATDGREDGGDADGG